MDILVCGAQVPFMAGGAELHMQNLVTALSAAGHRAELVRLPSAWDRERVFDAALAWRMVPVDADLVIATNFPSYYVRHPRKVVWLFHQHRAFFDAADSEWSDVGLDDESLELQRLLTGWDQVALGEAAARFTTSQTVAARLARFCGLDATPLYHPPPLFDRLAPGPTGEELFCATRLEGNKRPRLMVEALAAAGDHVQLSIAGKGSQLGELEELATALGVADQLELAGFVPDDDLVERYARCRAVVYVPHDEDYGYVTLQAFAAGKPVITAADSGGVLEWVEDGVTGIVTDGSAVEIGAAMDRLVGDRELAEKMGRAAKESVADLGWPQVVDTLVGASGA